MWSSARPQKRRSVSFIQRLLRHLFRGVTEELRRQVLQELGTRQAKAHNETMRKLHGLEKDVRSLQMALRITDGDGRPRGKTGESTLAKLSREVGASRDRHTRALKLLSRLEDRLTRLERTEKLARRERLKGHQKIDALLRRDYLTELLDEDLLTQVTARRFNMRSQNEEDGMVLALLQICGTPNRTFVEIGSGSGGGNSGVLALELGWRGLMVEKDPKRAERCAERYASNPRVRCIASEVSAANINQIIETHGFAGEIDFFSLDIDSFDYWVLEAMTACRPRVMVLEYNAAFGAERAVTVPRDAPLADGPKGYHGASLRAITELAERKGYLLVGCDLTGTNGFYLREDVRPGFEPISVDQAFRHKLRRPGPDGTTAHDDTDVIALAQERGLPLQFL